MSIETLLLLRQVLGRMTMEVGADDFAPLAERVLVALRELDEAIAAAQDTAIG